MARDTPYKKLKKKLGKGSTEGSSGSGKKLVRDRKAKGLHDRSSTTQIRKQKRAAAKM